MFDWVPVVFVTFKGVIFLTCMFFAIKWHYDQGKKQGKDTRTLLRSSALIALAFVVAVAAVLGLTMYFASRMGMDLSL
ncbi:MAG: hypothetical protein ACI4QS_07410 [Comamonas sp.]